jgi:unsaturated chondroitin disaccharide hydrolase
MSSPDTDQPVASDGPRVLDFDDALAFAQQQVRKLILASNDDHSPTYTKDGRWAFEDDPWAPNWCDGFLTGMLWVFADITGDGWWAEQAAKRSLALESRKVDSSTHDIGFVFEPSWGRWYDRDHDPRAREVLIDAGRTMAARLRQPGGYLCTWVDPGSTFIDIMMNVGVIFRAAQYSGDSALREVAMTHCRTTQRYLVRGDGSTVHEGWFDTQTGEFLRAATHQGWRSDSTWARGQAWAIYGFTSAYLHTGDADMLDTACRVADYYIRHTPSDGVPPNDWLDPAPECPREASAAAIAAAGMQHLADALARRADRLAAERYRAYAQRILTTLCSTEFIAADTAGWEGILRHATYHHRNGIAVDESVMWGEYYFVEALRMATTTERAGGQGNSA